MVLLQGAAELHAVIRADMAFQNAEAAAGSRDDQCVGEDSHVVSGDEVEDFQRPGDFPVRHDDQSVVLEGHVHGRQAVGAEQFRHVFQMFPRQVRVLENKVFQIHHGKPFGEFLRHGNGQSVGIHHPEGVRHGGMVPDDGCQGFRVQGGCRFKSFQGFVGRRPEPP